MVPKNTTMMRPKVIGQGKKFRQHVRTPSSIYSYKLFFRLIGLARNFAGNNGNQLAQEQNNGQPENNCSR